MHLNREDWNKISCWSFKENISGINRPKNWESEGKKASTLGCFFQCLITLQSAKYNQGNSYAIN